MPNEQTNRDQAVEQSASLKVKEKVTDDYIMKENIRVVANSPKMEPAFIRDVLPTLQPWIMLVLAHVVFVYTGNMLVILWITYVGRGVYDRTLLDDGTNVEKKYEKKFITYW